MNKIPNIKPFSEHGNSINEHIEQVILMEADTKASKELEDVLVATAKGVTATGPKQYTLIKNKAISAGGASRTSKTPAIDLGKKILKSANTQGLGLTLGKGKNAMAKSSYPITAAWKKSGGRNRTAKTDIIINGNNISLKQGESQIMSGAPGEARATFDAACRAMPKSWLNPITKTVEDGIDGLMTSSQFTKQWKDLAKAGPTNLYKMGGVNIQKHGGIVYSNTKKGKELEQKIKDAKKAGKPWAALETQRKALELGVVPKSTRINTATKKREFEIKFLRDADAEQERVTGLIATMFQDTDFKREFVFEAMTGKAKFGSEKGKATHFLVADWSGGAKYHAVKSSAATYVGNLLPQVSPDVRFKTGARKSLNQKTGYYTFYSVVSLMYQEAAKTEQVIYDRVNSGELEYLSEGFFDFIGGVWNKFKSWVSKVIAKAMNWIKKSADNIVKFFEMHPIIRFNNNVRW